MNKSVSFLGFVGTSDAEGEEEAHLLILSSDFRQPCFLKHL